MYLRINRGWWNWFARDTRQDRLGPLLDRSAAKGIGNLPDGMLPKELD